MLVGPARHIGSNLGDEPQRVMGTDTVQLREVHTRELVEILADIEARFIWRRFAPAACGPQLRGGRLAEVCELLQV